MAAKPLPATSQSAAPLPLGGSFGGDSNLPNRSGDNTNKGVNLQIFKSNHLHICTSTLLFDLAEGFKNGGGAEVEVGGDLADAEALAVKIGNAGLAFAAQFFGKV